MRTSRLSRYRLGLCACGVFLAGCQTVGPDYRGPPPTAVVNAPTAQGAFLSSADPVFSAVPAPDRWWRLYDSSQLDELVSTALTANTDLHSAQANLERSQALLLQAQAARQPTVGIDMQPSYQQLSVASYVRNADSLPTLGLYQAGISISYELDLFGRLRRGLEAAGADDEAAQAAFELTKITVAAETARAYADVCNAGEELISARRSLELQMQSADTIQRLVSAGRASSLDFTRSSGQVAQLRASIPILEAGRTNALYRLAALTGKPPAEYPKPVESCAGAPRLQEPIPIGDATALLRRRPDVREAERELAAASARIGVAVADLYPRVTLGVGVGSSGAMVNLLKAPTNQFGIGLGIHWQANQSLARARIAEAGALQKRALAQFDGVVLAALRDTESAMVAYSRHIERDQDLASAHARASEAEHQARQLFVAGKIDFLTLLDAQRTLASAAEAVAASHGQLADDQVTLFLALGGGWE